MNETLIFFVAFVSIALIPRGGVDVRARSVLPAEGAAEAATE